MNRNHLQLVSNNSEFIIQRVMDYLFYDESNPAYWDEQTETWGSMESATRYSSGEKMARSIRLKTGEIMPDVKNGEWVDLFDFDRSKASHPTAYVKRPTLKVIQAGPDQ